MLAALVAASLCWSYWPTLVELVRRWSRDPRYSHGFLVPAFALYLLWTCAPLRWDRPRRRWLRLLAIAAAGALRCLGAAWYFSWFEAISLLLTLGGLCWLWGGWATLRWTWPSLLFLIFMVPLPYRVETALGSPLQRIATDASTYLLQTLGLPAFSSGNTILIDQVRIGVVDACNGIGISYMFLALSVAAALIVRRPLLDGLLLVASAVPIALLVNVGRIVATGLLYVMFGRRVAGAVYHDLAGWLMMLVALAILFLECRLLKHIFLDVDGQNENSVHHAEPEREPGAPIISAEVKPPVLLFLVGTALVVAPGVITGLWTNRWQLSQELRLAVSQLDRIPLTVGDWTGRPEVVDPRELAATELDGAAMRHYQNARTGRAISLFLVCGRPGPVSIHTPETCYPGAGFEMVQPHVTRYSVGPDRQGNPVEFLQADFEQQQSFPPERLRIYWSWKAKAYWNVPDIPRWAFSRQPFLYKLYLIHQTSKGLSPEEDDAFRDFLRQLLPKLDQSMSRDSSASP
jgi:exosortase